MKRLAYIALPLLLLTLSCADSPRPDRRTRQLLTELDGYLRAQDMYVARKLDRIWALEQLAGKATDPQRLYEVEFSIADEYFSFNFDSTQVHLKRCIELAGRDPERSARAQIRLGELYSKAGNYMEARQLLYDQIDTTHLSDGTLSAYLLALYSFSHDLSGNSGIVERLSIPPGEPYRERLLQRLPPGSETWRELLRDQAMDRGELKAADSISRELLRSVPQEDRRYAIHAFYQSEIAEQDGRHDERLEWLVRSAESDLMNAVKDYASLTLVATDVLPVDVQHAFHYLQVSMQDALFYNARLRPWQISHFLVDVENDYLSRQAAKQRTTRILAILLGALTLLLLLLTRFLVSRSRRLARMRGELEALNTRLAQANETLQQLNQEVIHADSVKQAYILDFLRDLSEQIAFLRSEDNHSRNLLKQGKADQLLRELSLGGHSDSAREKFNETFDRTFLGMFPDFVARFNDLLQRDYRFNPPKGRLTPELRIFALIRLGVDDSKQIASMLDYSVSTIYNYKVEIRNHAAGDREHFDEAVRKIGAR